MEKGRSATGNPVLTDREFAGFKQFIFDEAGISLAPSKKALVSGRLAARLRNRGCASYADYRRLLAQDRDESRVAVDLLTTNETCFFREPPHFEFLRRAALEASPDRLFRVWSAASSSGEEAYSIAMVLADALGESPWEVFGSDISVRVLERARSGHYPLERAGPIPAEYLARHCLKGIGSQAGTFLVSRALRSRVKFAQVNLNRPLPSQGAFDVIFLRNVLIYFDAPTKRAVVGRLVSHLRPGGYFLVGHSETLNGVWDDLAPLGPSVYRKRLPRDRT